LVTLVGFENVGIVRSTRLLSGATGTRPGSTGCGIAWPAVVAPVREAGGELDPELEHAPTNKVITATAATNRAMGPILGQTY